MQGDKPFDHVGLRTVYRNANNKGAWIVNNGLTAALANQVLADGADLVAFGRPFIANQTSRAICTKEQLSMFQTEARFMAVAPKAIPTCKVLSKHNPVHSFRIKQYLSTEIFNSIKLSRLALQNESMAAHMG